MVYKHTVIFDLSAHQTGCQEKKLSVITWNNSINSENTPPLIYMQERDRFL